MDKQNVSECITVSCLMVIFITNINGQFIEVSKCNNVKQRFACMNMVFEYVNPADEIF